MSLIIALAGNKFATMIADGRQKDETTGIIISEKYQKIKEIEKELYLGYTGCTEICENIIEKYKEIMQSHNVKNADGACELLQFIAKSFYHSTNSTKNSQFVIIGKDSKEKIALWSMYHKTGFEITKGKPGHTGLTYAILNSEALTQEHIFNILLRIKCSNPNDITDVHAALIDCLKYAATKDDSINTNAIFASVF